MITYLTLCNLLLKGLMIGDKIMFTVILTISHKAIKFRGNLNVSEVISPPSVEQGEGETKQHEE